MPNYIGTIPNPDVRDFQRKRLYEAEEVCSFWKALKILPLREVNELVHNISKSFVITPPELITEGHAIPTAYATPKEIVLPFPICLSIPYICHEMAHVINYQLGPADHHGPSFSSTYLRIVKKFMGIEAFTELRRAFEITKVRYDFDVDFVIDVEIGRVDKRVAV